MREIKFRAWDKENGVMVYSNSGNDEYIWHFGMNGLYLLEHQTDNNDLHFYPQIEVEFMQYTGLKDKAGKEVFEGDIVNYSFDGVLNVDSGDCIKFDAGHFQIYNKNKSFHPVISDATYIEVVGNIYENENLLNQPH